MITRWSVENFKSFQGKNEIALAPLTFMCGANSSGKSSVIQSILLIKQTLEHSPEERVIALNGPLVRLGTFTDVLNYDAVSSGTNHIGIGWRIEPKGEGLNSSSPYYTHDESIISTLVDFVFDNKGIGADPEVLELQPDLKSSHVQATFRDEDDNDHCLSIEIERNTGRGRKLVYQTSSLAEGGHFLKERSTDAETKEAAISRFPKSSIVGYSVSHYSPSIAVIRFDRNLQIARRIANALSLSTPSRRVRLPSVSLPDGIIEIISATIQGISGIRSEEVLGKLFPAEKTIVLTADVLFQRLLDLSAPMRRILRENLSIIGKDIEKSIHDSLGMEKTLGPAPVERLTRAVNLTERFFRFYLRYIGPLRADPSPLYPLQALTSPTDVGPKGELTAAVLHLNSKRKVQTISSASFKEDPVPFIPTSMSLSEAVSDWLSYLGVADEVQILEKGKFGHELRVRTHGVSEFQDLTNVGVGVSQVLPIIVTCLLAGEGATLILEQPELHLHPAVQARLADFFIAMTFLGKQCIIETHSEHMIERTRFRIVQDEAEEVLKKTKIYFFAKEGGNTAVREVGLTKFGAIEDWPQDFFDQSQIANEQIVVKALGRHARKTTADVKKES